LTTDVAIADLTERIAAASPGATVRVTSVPDSEAVIRAYAPADDEAAIRAATQDFVDLLLARDGLDVQVLVYASPTWPPPQDT